MRSFKRAIALAATAASLLAASVTLHAAGGATLYAAESAAQSDYRNAVARCNRMSGDGQRRCMRDADAARKAALIKTQDMHGDATSLELNFLPGVGPAGDNTHDRGIQGGDRPTYRNFHDIERLPDNLARNDAKR